MLSVSLVLLGIGTAAAVTWPTRCLAAAMVADRGDRRETPPLHHSRFAGAARRGHRRLRHPDRRPPRARRSAAGLQRLELLTGGTVVLTGENYSLVCMA